MLKPSRHWVWNITIIVALVVAYGAAFWCLYPYLGFAGAPFAVVAVVVAAWMFGPVGGLLTLLLIATEYLLLLQATGQMQSLDLVKSGTLFGFLSLVVMAVAVGRMSDLDRKVKHYAFELQHQAFHDPLTNLPNRLLFSDRLEHALARASRGTMAVAVLFLDLDGFKRVNDQCGHVVGDRLLQAVATRMQQTVRVGDTVARLGGDEFVVLIEDIDGVDPARGLADRLTTTLSQPFIMNGVEHAISVSIGIGYCPAGDSHVEDLLREADRAMYQAKASGNGRYELFQPLVA